MKNNSIQQHSAYKFALRIRFRFLKFVHKNFVFFLIHSERNFMISAVIFYNFSLLFLKKIQSFRDFPLTSRRNLSERFVGQVTQLATFENSLIYIPKIFQISSKILQIFTKNSQTEKLCPIISEQNLFNAEKI